MARIVKQEDTFQEESSDEGDPKAVQLTYGQDGDSVSEEESDDDPAQEGVLLGTSLDKRHLAEVIRRFTRDDLSGMTDEVAAAIRMQVHQLSRNSSLLRICCTCGLWLLCRPMDDESVILLTKQGRLIVYGRCQLADVGEVTGYLLRIIVLMAMLLIFGVLFNMTSHKVPLEMLLSQKNIRWPATILCILVVVLVVLFLYSKRPRKDCGSTFRQHFEVQDMSCATYARESSRSCFACCRRRDRGHLRLIFSRFYPDEAQLSAGLPWGTPNVGGLAPVPELPCALAGEEGMVGREELRRAARRSSGGIGPKTSAVLAVLAVTGTMFEYGAFLNTSIDDESICTTKVAGCRWEVDNSPWVGKQPFRTNALPPDDYKAGGCNGEGEFCDKFYRPRGFCQPGDTDSQVFAFGLSCQHLPQLLQALDKTNVQSHSDVNRVQYVVRQSIALQSVPTASMEEGSMIVLARSLALARVDGKTSNESLRLAAGQDLDLAGLQAKCRNSEQGALHFRFEHMPELEALFEEDCAELQRACMAEAYSPRTFAWWPPSRWADLSYTRAACSFKPLPVLLSNGGRRVWRRLEDSTGSGEAGLSCHGEPLDALPSDSQEQCKKACEERPGCSYAFFGGGVPGAATEGAPPAEAVGECVLYTACPSEGSRAAAAGGGGAGEWLAVDCRMPRLGGMPAAAVSRAIALRSLPGKAGADLEACSSACLAAGTFFTQCNAYAYEKVGNSSLCTIFGPKNLQVPDASTWAASFPDASVTTVGKTGGATNCSQRVWPLPSNRRRMDRPGVLLQHSDHFQCSGCTLSSLTSYYLELPNLVELVTNLICMICVIHFVWRAHRVHAAKAEFSGKPEVDMVIAHDPANPFGFEKREHAYNEFLRRCWEVAHQHRKSAKDGKALGRGDDAEGHEAPMGVEFVRHESFDAYELTNTRRTKCYVDERLLGLVPGERAVAAWSETAQHGLAVVLLASFLYVLCVVLFMRVMPPHVTENNWLRVLLFVLIPAAWIVRYYIMIRSNVQGICVVTSHKRVLQLSRGPSTGLGLLFPKNCGLCPVRLDCYLVDNILYLQLDMPLQSLWSDWWRSWGRTPWRRGIITFRCDHGILQARRYNGEGEDVFKAVSWMADTSKRAAGLKMACTGTAEIFGVNVSRDLLSGDEKLVWERQLIAYGSFTDPFDYSSLLALTDRRLLVLRARCPKPLSCRGLCLGPLTCGFHCMSLQELLGRHAGMTIASLSLNYLESYATTRTRSPAYWPGFGPPINALGVVFMAKFMDLYPAALTILQRPYGLQPRLRVEGEVRLSATNHGHLRIRASDQPDVPRGHLVVSVKDPDGVAIGPDDPRWSAEDGGDLQPGSEIVLEAVDQRWRNCVDEPWLFQLRRILDQVLGRQEASEDTWEPLDEPVEPPQPGCCQQLCAKICGGDFLGLHPSSSARVLHTRESSREGSEVEDDQE